MTLSAAAIAFVLAPVLGSALREATLRGAQEHVTELAVSETRYTHLGCFNDVEADRILKLEMKSDSMTPSLCCDSCAILGAAFCATQYGTECWCTSDRSLDYTRHGVGKCDYWCAGDPNTTCGGYKTFEVYSIEPLASHMTSNYIGCFADSPVDRIFTDKLIDREGMTPAMCETHCTLDKSTSGYYAVQWGNECWCGIKKSAGEYERHGRGACNIPCAGDPSALCGGYYSFDLFTYGGSPEPEPLPLPMPDTPADTLAPSAAPTARPTTAPTTRPTIAPTAWSTASPIARSTAAPTDRPSGGGDGAAGDELPVSHEAQMMELMEFHNAVRCVHDAAELTYSDELAASAYDMAKGLASSESSCGYIDPAMNTGMGVNMHMCATSDPNVSCFSPSDAMQEFYGNQVGGGPPTNWGVHARQVLWIPTTVVGCGMHECVKGGMTYAMLVCYYSPPAVEDIGENVAYQTKSFQDCGYTRG